ncbi:MAG: YnbE family lipoprotein [Gammaproteobacteria bacterium]|nr:YnbE family lipoprotein [Gammaproteobacteria bacterium]
MKINGIISQQIARQSLVRPAIFTYLLLCFLTIGCTPKVEVSASDKPITINLNVKIEHEIRVKVEKELEDVLSEDSGLF